MANGDDERRSRLPSWVPMLMALASLIFTSGQYYFKIQAMEIELIRLRDDSVRKETFKDQLDFIDYKISGIQKILERNEALNQQILKYLR
jgi:hypothetical protein